MPPATDAVLEPTATAGAVAADPHAPDEPDEPPRRVRMDAESRRIALLDVAQATFAERGYQQASLAEIAKRARVSKTLLYHYYPDGRPQLYRLVAARIADDLMIRCRHAVTGATPREDRLVRLVDATFGFFADEPDAFRLLMVEPWSVGDPAIVGLAMAVRMELTREITNLFATTETDLETLEAGAIAAVGSLVHECDLWMSGQLSRTTAVAVTVAFLRGGLRELGLLR